MFLPLLGHLSLRSAVPEVPLQGTTWLSAQPNDARWRVVYMSHEQRLMSSGSTELVSLTLGGHLFGTDQLNWGLGQRHGPNSPEAWREFLSGVGGMVLADTTEGRDELRTLVDPSLREVVDELAPEDGAVASWSSLGDGVGGRFEGRNTALRIRDAAGTLRGTVLFVKPAAGMSVLAAMAFQRDPQHLARMHQVGSPGRRPAAILFADLESSSALARRLSTASYFALVAERIVETVH